MGVIPISDDMYVNFRLPLAFHMIDLLLQLNLTPTQDQGCSDIITLCVPTHRLGPYATILMATGRGSTPHLVVNTTNLQAQQLLKGRECAALGSGPADQTLDASA